MDHDNSAYEQLYPCPDPCAWRRRLEQLRRDAREAFEEFAAWPLVREELVHTLRALAAEILSRVAPWRDTIDPPATDDERVAEAAAREVAAGPNGTAAPVGAEAASSTEASNGELPCAANNPELNLSRADARKLTAAIRRTARRERQRRHG